MKILSTFNRLRRTLGLNDFTPNYSDDDQTQTEVINEIQDNELTVEDQTNLDVDLSEIEQIEIDEYEKQDLSEQVAHLVSKLHDNFFSAKQLINYLKGYRKDERK